MRKKAFDVYIETRSEEPVHIEYSNDTPREPVNLSFLVWIFAFLFVGAVLFLGYSLFEPSVDVLLYPKTEKFQYDKEIKTQLELANLDSENGIIPLYELEDVQEYTAEFPAVETDLAEKAEGILRVFNDADEPVALATSTQFMAGDGKIFKIVERISIPANGGSTDVMAVAAKPGSDYNISPTTFSVPKLKSTPLYTKIYAKSPEKMDGGKEGKGLKAMPEDVERAHNVMIQDALSSSEKALMAKGEGYYLFKDSIEQEIVSTSTEVSINPLNKVFTYKLVLQSKISACKTEDIQTVAFESLKSNISAGKQMIENGFNYYIVSGKDGVINISAFAPSYYVLDETVKNDIIGLDIPTAKDVIETVYPGEINALEIKIFPRIKKELPQNTENITLKIMGVDE